MSDEIKINKANKSITFINNGIAFSQFGIANEILDLITNLQQENKALHENNQNMQEEMARVWEENERLKNDVEDISCSHFSLFKSYDDYKSRCEKINEILKESPDFNYSNDYIILKRKIEGILQGENNE